MELSEILNIDYPVTQSTVNKLLSVASRLTIKKKEYVIEQGKRTDSLFFITDGLFRGVHVRDDHEDTILFAVTGDPFTSLHSMAHDEPAEIAWQALDKSEILAIRYTDFNRLLETEDDLLRWWSRALLDQVYVLERRYVWIGSNDAASRYESLVKTRPEITTRVPVKYIAQYLNVKPETLSRIRARLARKS